jgi:hypothetical protein
MEISDIQFEQFFQMSSTMPSNCEDHVLSIAPYHSIRVDKFEIIQLPA